MPEFPDQPAAKAAALRAQGRLEEALGVRRQIVAASPASAAAEHNLASALADLGRFAEAEKHIRKAFEKGSDAPETWLILGRCLQSLGQFDAAERAFTQALTRRPAMYDAQRDLAQLRWMLTSDKQRALADIEQAVAAAPNNLQLVLLKAQVLEYVGCNEEAYAVLAKTAVAYPGDAAIAITAAQLAAGLGQGEDAVAHARRAKSIAPDWPIASTMLAIAHLCAGAPTAAIAALDEASVRVPNDQHALALRATAWRLLEDPRYRQLYDYERLVVENQIDTPEGWTSLEAYLADLRDELHAVHRFTTHPFNQSVRMGSQAPDLLHIDRPVFRALPQALDGPIRKYIDALGPGEDPIRARARGGYAFKGLWSIRTRAGGFHIDHVHPEGWISSACYVELPALTNGKEGWIKFGEPGIVTKPALGPEHFVKPAPGKLVLFPSYMWHGTVAFTDGGERLTIAFDLVPA